MDKRALVVVPTREIEAQLKALGFAHVERLVPWRAITHADVTISAVPALHDVYEISYVLEQGPQRVLFAGDTGLHDDLHAIAERFAPTTAILPVDGARVRTSERRVLDPKDAVTATRILGPKLVLPSHADGRYVEPVLSLLAESIDDAARLFASALAAEHPSARCLVPTIGQRVRLPA
jgi:L-ascorbate metabolism protein UlaG (beta-lactamase superfamily)